jgi:glycerol-3-phosphate dehydrogenase
VERGRAVGARVEDVEAGGSIEVRAQAVVLCAGAWTEALVRPVRPDLARICRMSRGVHLVLPALPTEDALIVPRPERGRVAFLLPWHGRTLVGTTDEAYEGDPSRVTATAAEREELLAAANRALEERPWSAKDVISEFAGLRVLPPARGGTTAALSRELSIEEPIPGLVMPIGGKLTSARVDAAALVDRAARAAGIAISRSMTAELPFPWSPQARLRHWQRETLERGFALGLDEAVIDACQARYGRRIDLLFGLVEERPELGARIADDAPACLAEVVHAARYEMARNAIDVLRRRMPLLLVTRIDKRRARHVADLLAVELGWSVARRDAELAALIGPVEAAREPG